MDDLISRQAAIDAVAEGLKRTFVEYRDVAEKMLNKVPSAQPEPHWIPCSERLPEEGEVVLTQAKFKDDMKMAVSSRIDYNYWTGWGTRDINIIAWMPLPKPYKEHDDADHD